MKLRPRLVAAVVLRTRVGITREARFVIEEPQFSAFSDHNIGTLVHALLASAATNQSIHGSGAAQRPVRLIIP